MHRFIIIFLMVSLFSCSREIKDFYNTDDNNKMYYESYGTGESAVVFVHGWSVNCRSWDDQIDFFKDKYRVILVDLPGFGNSGNDRNDWSMQHYGTDVAGLCKKLDLKNVYLVGWSLGTAVVVETAKLLGDNTKAVVLIDQLHQTDYVFDSIGVENWFNRQVSKYKDFNAWYKSFNNDSTIAAKYLSMMPPEDKLPDWWKHGIISFFKWQEDDLKESVSGLNLPIRAINASNIETNEEQWESFYKDYKLTIFENSTHFLVWEYPQKFNETLLRIIYETAN